MWQTMTYFAFDLPDRPGELANILGQFANAGLNLLGLWGDATRGPVDERWSSGADACPQSKRLER